MVTDQLINGSLWPGGSPSGRRVATPHCPLPHVIGLAVNTRSETSALCPAVVRSRRRRNERRARKKAACLHNKRPPNLRSPSPRVGFQQIQSGSVPRKAKEKHYSLFLPLSGARVAESLRERVVVDLQLRYLSRKMNGIQYSHDSVSIRARGREYGLRKKSPFSPGRRQCTLAETKSVVGGRQWGERSSIGPYCCAR